MAVVPHDGTSILPLTPLVEERLQHVLGQLDDVDVPRLRGLQTGHVLFLLTSQVGVVEEVTVGAPIEKTLEQRTKCKMFRNASLQINCRFLKFFFGESILFAGGLVGGMATKHTTHYTTTIELTEKIHSRDQINIVVIKKHFFF